MRLRALAPAKVNLCLFVGGPRRDQRHELVTLLESISLADELRRAGLRVDVYPEVDKMGKQFKYASSLGIPFVAIIGEDERLRLDSELIGS